MTSSVPKGTFTNKVQLPSISSWYIDDDEDDEDNEEDFKFQHRRPQNTGTSSQLPNSPAPLELARQNRNENSRETVFVTTHIQTLDIRRSVQSQDSHSTDRSSATHEYKSISSQRHSYSSRLSSAQDHSRTKQTSLSIDRLDISTASLSKVRKPKHVSWPSIDSKKTNPKLADSRWQRQMEYLQVDYGSDIGADQVSSRSEEKQAFLDDFEMATKAYEHLRYLEPTQNSTGIRGSLSRKPFKSEVSDV